MIELSGITDRGLLRAENQDHYALCRGATEQQAVAVVCDGMGGVKGGQLASTIAVRAFMDSIQKHISAELSPEEIEEICVECVLHANSAVFSRGLQETEYFGMGTTLVSAFTYPGGVLICNVGDSRAYHMGEDGIRCVTRDHSLVEEMVRQGDLTEDAARHHNKRNIITRAIGSEPTVECDTYHVPFAEGETILLCSDGLVITVSDEEMLMEIAREGSPHCLESLLALSRERGAPDNVTAVLIRNRKGV